MDNHIIESIDSELITSRIKQIIKSKNQSLTEFETNCGLKNGYIKSISQKGSAIGSDKLAQIYTTYRDINILWLLTGEGNMLLKEDNSNNKKPIKIGKREGVSTHSRPDSVL